MNFYDRFIKVFRTLLPAPFTIAVILTFITFIIALFFGKLEHNKGLELLSYWDKGLWDTGLMKFAMQMMLMLVLGHVLALTKPAHAVINAVVKQANSTEGAAAMVAFMTMLVALFNWGLGLIFGAILARKMAEHAMQSGIRINYPILGAAGYSGLMVWHGGFSGSSLAKVAEPGHLRSLVDNTGIPGITSSVPNFIGYDQTVFSGMNISVSILLLTLVPAVLYLTGKRLRPTEINLQIHFEPAKLDLVQGAERLDHSRILGIGTGSIILFYAFYKMFVVTGFSRFFTPDNINLLLFGMGLIMHRSLYYFVKAVESAIGGAAGILIQFPIYFGIMGMMKGAGLVDAFSEYIASVSTTNTFPVFTFISAAIVNIFVPSGGGQWAIQGPILVQAATELSASLPKNIMAFAYGDQVSNMLQPFWALPLLGITGLKAKEILPYTLLIMLVGITIFLGCLVLF